MEADKIKAKYVLIGNSAAAIGAAESIRKNDKDNEIIIVADEPYPAYSRPLIPKLLAGEIKDEKEMYYRNKDFYEENNIKTLFGKKAIGIEPESKSIILEDKNRISYEKLLIATGGSPFIPPIKGYGKDVLTFISWGDANKIIEKTKDIRKVVIIGAGLIGLKAAESLNAIGKEVTVVELSPRVLSAITDEKASNIMRQVLEDSGIKIITGNTVEEIIRKNKKITAVLLKNNERISCGLVIAAIGVTPNTSLVKNTAIKLNRGILVDSYMQTSIKDIYAAGDVAEAYDLVNGQNRVIPIWPNAYLQGEVAGQNMSGLKRSYNGSFVMNSIEFCSTPIISYGIVTEGQDCEVIEDCKPEEKIYKKIIMKNNIVIGAIFINKIDRAGIIAGLIRDRIDVSNFKEKLIKDELGLIMLPKKLIGQRLEETPKVKI